MRSEHYDTIVVGAAPGGATAAFELASAGLRTLLIEKEKLGPIGVIESLLPDPAPLQRA